MKLSRILSFLFLFSLAAPAHAMVLRGVVSEVTDGRSVVVLSNGRKVVVLMKGVEAPDIKQDFGDVAQQYLASLILDKAVEVDISELKGTYVVGKVIYNQLDIGLQVIRDGAAWYDIHGDRNLSEAERTVYAGAEQAARSELRGLWRDGSPMPPWEWRRAETARFYAMMPGKARGPALQTEDLLFARKAVAPVSSKGPAGKPTQKPLNTPGQDVDFSAYLSQGRISIVYFYADWCPACRSLTPLMEQLNASASDKQVLFMNIENWNSPVTRLYGITFVPYLKIYDKSGKLVAEGKDARGWMQQNAR